MELQKYDGNIHPDEWIKDIHTYFNHSGQLESSVRSLMTAKSLVDSTIKLPIKIDNFEELRNALKEDISFTVFKNTNKRRLQSLKYIPEKEGGKTSKFISTFRKLCYNAEISDIEEQKKFFYQSLPNNNLLIELLERKTKITSMDDLIKEFEEIVTDESIEKSNLIKNGSAVALKHVATGKYLSSIKNLCYKTGGNIQLVFAGSSELDPNSLWEIGFNSELATYTSTYINLQHIKSNKSLGIHYNIWSYHYYKSPLTEHTEVSCGGNDKNWIFSNSELKNHGGYLKSNDIINLRIKKTRENNQEVFLRSHDIQFTIGSDTFQEVVCHNERLGGNDEWCIELIKRGYKY